jgi:hypothetical protein
MDPLPAEENLTKSEMVSRGPKNKLAKNRIFAGEITLNFKDGEMKIK